MLTFVEGTNRSDAGDFETLVESQTEHREQTHCFRSTEVSTLAKKVLLEILQHGRFADLQRSCIETSCENCLAPHLPRITRAILLGLPVTFVLPAFPGKSPNPLKVLGPLPDMAEKQALNFLQKLCNNIKQHYLPGAQIIICSDGRVFSDLVGMKDQDVTDYRDELTQIISSLGLSSISTFDLEDYYPPSPSCLSFDQMRHLLMNQYGISLETVKREIKEKEESNRLYCGITRFLLEDAHFPGQKKSRTALQKESRIKAYEVLRRSRAWSRLIENCFPDAVRLSIHPQACGSTKLGIQLSEPGRESKRELDQELPQPSWQEKWITPWHGVAVRIGERYVLLKRSQAEALGATLVYQGPRPSHYQLTPLSEPERKI